MRCREPSTAAAHHWRVTTIFGSTNSFVALGHHRGDKDGPNPKLPEVLDKVRALKPAFLVLTGDIIIGGVEHNPAVPATVNKEWAYIDSATTTVGVPVYRVPGNHDIQDLTTRHIYWQRTASCRR